MEEEGRGECLDLEEYKWCGEKDEKYFNNLHSIHTTTKYTPKSPSEIYEEQPTQSILLSSFSTFKYPRTNLTK